MDVEILTIDEVAELLHTPVATLRFWRYRGTGPRSFKAGRRVMYRKADVAAWVDAQANATPAA